MGLRKRFVVAVVGVAGSAAESQRREIDRYRSIDAARSAGADEWRRILFVHAPHVDRYRVVIEHDGVEVGEVDMPDLPGDAGAPGILDETVTPLGTPVGAAGEPADAAESMLPDHDEAASNDEVAAAASNPADEPVPDEQLEVAQVDDGGSVADDMPSPALLEAPAAPPPSPAPVEDALGPTGKFDAIPSATDVTGEQPMVTDDVAGAEAAAPAPASGVIEEMPDGPVPEDIIERFAEYVRAEEERAAERAERPERSGRGRGKGA